MERLWIISRICEEFHCLPTRAALELDQDPEQMALHILPLRAFQRAKSLHDSADTAEKRKRLPDSPLIDFIQEIEFERAREELEARREPTS